MAYEKICGSIIEYVYTSDESMYKVATISSNGEEISIVGSFPMLEIGLSYEFVGEFITHPKYGRQFSIKSYLRSNSYTKDGLISYLSSDKFPGIGVKLAEKIVSELGLEAIDKIIDDPKCLDGIKGLTEPRKILLYEELKNSSIEEKMFLTLFSYGLSSKMIQKLFESYGEKTLNKIEEDPYRLIYEVEGFGFSRADAIALKLGYTVDDIRRIKACIVYTLNYVCYKQGYTYLTHDQLINSAINTIAESSIKPSKFEDALNEIVEEKKIIADNDMYFDTYLYNCEANLAEKINQLRTTTFTQNEPSVIKDAIKEVESQLKINYTSVQEEAIFNSLSNKLSIITGGPGTGKSTILKGILYSYASLAGLSLDSEELELKVLLASPTGRAAKRMSEVTIFKASTIHKALNMTYDGTFQFNKDNILPCSLLIVDEVSMLDISLAWNLFQALSNKCQVILVGDINQLPSVGPGNVLADLIISNSFKVTRLNQIIRQASDSNIVMLSNMVLNEKIDFTIFNEKKDTFFYSLNQDDIIPFIFRLLDKYVLAGNDLFSGLQILAPIYKGKVGIDEINKAVQARYNDSKDFVKRGDQLIKVNDKVLQIKNDPKLKIMNGDIGRVLEIRKDDDGDYLRINFDGLIVDYPTKMLENLTLAYAISIHKSQGSEFETVIMIADSSYYIMLKKKIIYTGITRAKKKLILLGQARSLIQGVQALDIPRQTSLSFKLNKKNEINNKIYDKDIPFDTLGEYDMEGITPYTFMEN